MLRFDSLSRCDKVKKNSPFTAGAKRSVKAKQERNLLCNFTGNQLAGDNLSMCFVKCKVARPEVCGIVSWLPPNKNTTFLFTRKQKGGILILFPWKPRKEEDRHG